MAPHSSTHVRDIGYADTTTRCVCLYSTHGASHSRTIIGSYLLHQQCLVRQIKLSPPDASFVKGTDIYNCPSWTTPPASNQAAPASCGPSWKKHNGQITRGNFLIDTHCRLLARRLYLATHIYTLAKWVDLTSSVDQQTWSEDNYTWHHLKYDP